MDKAAEAKVGGERGVDGAVRGAEAKHELPGPEAALGGAREEGERVDEHRRRRLDLRLCEAAERHVLHGGDACEAFLLEAGVLDAVEGHHQGERRGCSAAMVGHCRRRSRRNCGIVDLSLSLSLSPHSRFCW